MKQWTCICGSKVFILTRLQTLIVDFSQEGAVEGHPRINPGSIGSQGLICSSCGTKVPEASAGEMLEEII